LFLASSQALFCQIAFNKLTDITRLLPSIQPLLAANHICSFVHLALWITRAIFIIQPRCLPPYMQGRYCSLVHVSLWSCYAPKEPCSSLLVGGSEVQLRSHMAHISFSICRANFSSCRSLLYAFSVICLYSIFQSLQIALSLCLLSYMRDSLTVLVLDL